MQLPQPRYEPRFDFGQVITLAGFIITQVVIVLGFVWWLSGWKAEVDIRLAQQAAEIANAQSETSRLQSINAPRIDALDKANSLQDERIGNIIEGNQRRDKVTDELRTAVMELTRTVAILNERLPPGRRSDLGETDPKQMLR